MWNVLCDILRKLTRNIELHSELILVQLTLIEILRYRKYVQSLCRLFIVLTFHDEQFISIVYINDRRLIS